MNYLIGKRTRKKKTRKRKGKGKKYGNLKIREIKPSVKPTTRSSVKTRESVYELDIDAIIEDERKNQELEKRYNTTVEEWKKTPFYKPKKKKELAELANQIEFQLRNRKDREMTNSLIQTKNLNKKHYAKMSKDKDGNVYLPKGEIISRKTKKKYYDEGKMRAAAARPRKIFGGRRSRKKRKKLMCPKNCCGVPVDKCGCPVSCPHCNCPEIKRLRKLLKRTRKKCNKKRKKTRRRKAGKKVLLRYTRKKPNTLRRTIMEDTRRREQENARGVRMRTLQEQATQRFRIQVINRGQLTETLTSFISLIRRILANPTLQTREKYAHFNAMYDIVNRAIRGELGEITVEISQQDRSRIALIGNLLRQFRTQIETNFDIEHLGDSNSDEEATENTD